MKATKIYAVVLCVQAGLAVPHGNHQQFHDKRSIVTSYSVVTNVVTVTDYNAIVWVDHAGNIVKTEQKTLAPTSAATSDTPVTNTHPTSSDGVSSLPITTNTQSAATVALPADLASKADDRVDNKPFSEEHTTPLASVSSSSTPPEVSVEKEATHPGTTNSAANIPGFGVAYDAFSDSGCRPNINGDFAFLANKGASTIRVYDNCFTEAVNAATANNLKLMIGLTSFTDFDTNLAKLIKSVTSAPASWTPVTTVFIGNELVNNGLESAAAVAARVGSARALLTASGYRGAVVTVDTWISMSKDPTICSTSDFCAANAHAFFDGKVLPDHAGSFVRMAQRAVADKNPGKRVVISESGWPHAGAAVGAAVPSVENQRTAMASLVKEFGSTPGDLFLFMAYDAKYKVNQPEIERNFGIFDPDHYNGIP